MQEGFLDKTGVRVSALVFGVLMVLFSLPFVAAGIGDLVSGGDPAVSLMLMVFFGLSSVIGAFLGYWGFKRPDARPSSDNEDLERRLLQFARSHGGQVTVSQLAAESPLSAAEGRKALEQLEMQGICHSAPSSTGGLIYRFPDFMPDGKKTPSEVEFDFGDEAAERVAQAAAAKHHVD